MKFNAVRRRLVSTSAAALAATAVLGGSALASGDAVATGCPAVATAQVFAPWQDLGEYFMAPGGDIEAGAAGWELTGGAGPTAGSAPFGVAGTEDHLALSLPAGSSATTPPMCIGVEHRSMRFVAHGPAGASLRVAAIYEKRAGTKKRVHIAKIGGTGAWQMTDVLAMIVNEDAEDYGNALTVALRFTPHGDGDWQIDDVYVDPWRKS